MGFEAITSSLSVACQNPYKAALGGILVSMTGLDAILPLPRPVHWAVTGVLIDAYCGAPVGFNKEGAMAAVSGVAGPTTLMLVREIIL